MTHACEVWCYKLLVYPVVGASKHSGQENTHTKMRISDSKLNPTVDDLDLSGQICR